MFIFSLLVVYKLVNIQFIQGNQYRELAEKRTVKNVEIPANRGNVYSADGSLLATSVPKYDIRLKNMSGRLVIPWLHSTVNPHPTIKRPFARPGPIRTVISFWPET
jgi:hypothetical protein